MYWPIRQSKCFGFSCEKNSIARDDIFFNKAIQYAPLKAKALSNLSQFASSCNARQCCDSRCQSCPRPGAIWTDRRSQTHASACSANWLGGKVRLLGFDLQTIYGEKLKLDEKSRTQASRHESRMMNVNAKREK